MELTYRMENGYRLPNLDVPEAPKVGKYGMLRRSYLKSHRNGYYTGMQLSGRLNAHLEKIDREATEMVERLTARMAREQGVTEELKASDQMKWVGYTTFIQPFNAITTTKPPTSNRIQPVARAILRP